MRVCCTYYCIHCVFYMHTCSQLYVHIRATYGTHRVTYGRACMHEFLSVVLVQIRANTYGHCAVTVALLSLAHAQVSALSPRGSYGKIVAWQRKRRQIAKYNKIRSALPISAACTACSRRQFGQARPAARCSAMAILETTERCRPGDGAMIGCI